MSVASADAVKSFPRAVLSKDAVHRHIQMGHAAPLREILARAAARGEPLRDGDHATIVATLLGPLFYRRLVSREPFDARFVKAVVTRAINLAAR